MSINFFQTRMGQLFFEVTLPKLIKEIGRLADGALSPMAQSPPLAPTFQMYPDRLANTSIIYSAVR